MATKATESKATEVEGVQTEIEVDTPARKFVKYKGKGTRRVISKTDWETVGAKGQPAAEWNWANRHLIPLEDFSPEALAYLKRDGSFTVVTE